MSSGSNAAESNGTHHVRNAIGYGRTLLLRLLPLMLLTLLLLRRHRRRWHKAQQGMQ